jgi:hypothetical protein
MFCPNCRCEFIAGVTQCSDCDVPLVDALDTETPNFSEGKGIVSLWAGNDPRRFEEIKQALDSAKIPFLVPEAAGYFIFPSMRPKLEIAVDIADRERAEKVLSQLDGTSESDESDPEESDAFAIPESGDNTDVPASFLGDISEEWDDEAASSEVWRGSEEEFADTLAVCLRENGIASHRLSEQGEWRLVVRPEQEGRAKEIVREVVDATPPE